MPPSTRNVEAVMNVASSLARNATAAASSSGSANLPTGTWTSRRAAFLGSLAKSSFSSGVLTGPGHRAFTRMPILLEQYEGLADHDAADLHVRSEFGLGRERGAGLQDAVAVGFGDP